MSSTDFGARGILLTAKLRCRLSGNPPLQWPEALAVDCTTFAAQIPEPLFWSGLETTRTLCLSLAPSFSLCGSLTVSLTLLLARSLLSLSASPNDASPSWCQQTGTRYPKVIFTTCATLCGLYDNGPRSPLNNIAIPEGQSSPTGKAYDVWYCRNM